MTTIILLLLLPQHCSYGNDFLNPSTVWVYPSIVADIITLSDKKHDLLFNLCNTRKLRPMPIYGWPNLNPEAWILNNPKLEWNISLIPHLADRETEAQWYKLIAGIKGDSGSNCGSPCLGRVCMYLERVWTIYGLQRTTRSSNPGSPLVMWARVGLRHFSETVSPYKKWNGYYLPCSKSSDCWGWSVEVAGRRLARRRPWQSGSRLLKAHVVARPLLGVSDNFLTVKNESCSCVRQSSFWRLLFFNLKGEKV